MELILREGKKNEHKGEVQTEVIEQEKINENTEILKNIENKLDLLLEGLTKETEEKS